MKKILFGLLIVLCSSFKVNALVLDEPQRFILGFDLVETTTGIIIASDGVTVDLNGHSITGGLYGIIVAPGVSNIGIENGFVGQVAQSGIVIGEGAGDVIMTQMRIAGCAKHGVDVLGTHSGDSHTNLYFQGVFIDQCGFGPTGGSALNWNYVKNSVLRDISISRFQNATTPLTIGYFNHCDQVSAENIVMTNFTAPGLIGYDFQSCFGWLCRNMVFANGVSFAGDVTGFNFEGDTGSCILNLGIVGDCISAGDMIGFNFGPGAQENAMQQCSVIVNQGASFVGFKCTSTSVPFTNKDNTFAGCASAYNDAVGPTYAIGCMIDGSDDGSLTSCRLGYNQCVTGTSIGLWFNENGGKGWNVRECGFVHNEGSDSASSYGVLVETGTQENLFFKNVAFSNGQTSANQLSGVPSGSVSAVSRTNINSVTSPWTNLAISM